MNLTKQKAGAESQPASTMKESFRARRILVPIDFSDPSRKALQYAASLAEQFGSKLILFYAIEPVATPDFAYHPLMKETSEVVGDARKQMRKLCEETSTSSAVDQIIVEKGVPHARITETAKSLDADLIVIATHGNTGLKHVLLGSTAERVVRHASCPVLVVRA